MTIDTKCSDVRFGQKQTFCGAIVMSAFSATMCRSEARMGVPLNTADEGRGNSVIAQSQSRLGAAMRLVWIEPERPYSDRHTLECRSCEQTIKVIVECILD